MRYAVIDWLDCIIYESDDLDECISFAEIFDDYCRGIFDCELDKYIKY